MPSLKPLETYPIEYREVLLKAVTRGAYSIPHSSSRSAKATRRDLYNYRTMLRAHALEGNEECGRLAVLFDPLVFNIEDSVLLISDAEAETFLSEII